MARLMPCLFVLVSLLVDKSGAKAQDPLSRAEVATLAKPATALVEIKPGTSGSGFCVHPSGLFVINEHVVRSVSSNDSVTLVLDPGLKTQKLVKARVIQRDKQLDLALLRAEGEHKLPALKLGSDDNLSELTELIAFGFPFGKTLAKGEQYPTVTVNVANVSALRTDAKGELTRIQLDSNLSPGNSGGPVLDRSGKVMGVVVSGIVGAGINNLIPVRHVRRFLDRPVLAFTPPVINAKNRYDAIDFIATAATLVDADALLEVELILTAADGSQRRIPMKADNGQFRARAVPFPSASGKPPIRLEIQYSDGSVSAVVGEDPKFRIGEESVLLSQVRHLKPGPKAEALLADGRKLEGVLKGLDALTVMLGGQRLDLKLAGAQEVRGVPRDQHNRLACAIVVRKSGQEIGRHEEIVYLEGTQRANFDTLRQGKFIKPVSSAVPVSYLNILSTAGDFIGQGNSYSYKADELKVSWKNGTICVEVDGWKAEFASPRGDVLGVGEYANAKRYPFNEDSPGICFSGKGRGANQIAGHFVIWELERKDNTLVRVAVDFVQRAEIKGPPLYGMLRYNSKFE